MEMEAGRRNGKTAELVDRARTCRSAAPVSAHSRRYHRTMGTRRTTDTPDCSPASAHADRPAAADRIISDAQSPRDGTRIAMPSDPWSVVPSGAEDNAVAPRVAAAVSRVVPHIDRVGCHPE